MNFKKQYQSPETSVTRVSLEVNFLASTRSANSSMDLSIEDVDSGSFWDYE